MMSDDRTFVGVDLAGATFRDVDLSQTIMRGVMLSAGDIDGVISGLKVNGVEVAPLIEAELDRMFPERLLLRPTNQAELVTAIDTVESMWSETLQRAFMLDDSDLHRSVGGEWSLVETLRHLVFVTDAWFLRSVLDLDMFHPLGLPPTFLPRDVAPTIDPEADPSIDDVMEARNDRFGRLQSYAKEVSDAELGHPVMATARDGFPPARERTPLECLHVLCSEEWAHHRYAVRDLNKLET